MGEIFAIWNGGLAIYGGLITGAIVLYIFADRKLINTWDFLDIAAPSVMIAQSLGRWGNFFNQEAYGAAVDNLNYLPAFIRDQMYIEGSYRQPTFLYESLWNLLGFALILIFRRKWKSLRRGHITAFYLIWYGFGRMVIEGMRTDSLMFFGLRVVSMAISCPYRSWYFYHSISKSKEGPLLYFRGGKLNVRSCIYSCSPCFDCLF